MINIQLPKEVQDLESGNLFDRDGLIRDDILSKYLAYNPEIVRIYGLAIAELKKTKREGEIKIRLLELALERKKSLILLKLDSNVYKNESMREARVVNDKEYNLAQEEIIKKQEELIELDYETDVLLESYWKHKGMGQSLDAITKLRLSERKY